jgi:indole-3-acetate monooxygenase
VAAAFVAARLSAAGDEGTFAVATGSVGAVDRTLLSRIAELAPLIESAAEAHDRERSLSPDVVAAVRSVGGFRLYLPAAYGGPEVDPITGFEAIASLAEADGATGWCAAIASQTAHAAGVLHPDGAREMFADPDAIACGAFAPNGTVSPIDDGVRVTGSWSWGSGSPIADWMSGGVIGTDGMPALAFMRRSELSVRDTWYSGGLRGTGSHDFDADGVEVPMRRVLAVGRAKPHVESPLASLTMFVLFGSGIAAVMVGIARRALREFTALAVEKKPTESRKTVAESPLRQATLARAEAAIRSSTAYLHDEVGRAWDYALRGERVPTDERLRVRLASSHVGDECVKAVESLYRAGGGSSVYSSSPLQRCFRDVMTASAHIMVSDRAYETAGRYRLGLSIDERSL